MHCIFIFFCVCFWRRLDYHKDDDEYDYKMLTDPVSNRSTAQSRIAAQPTVTEAHDSGTANDNSTIDVVKLHLENKLWLLMTSFIAPIVCIGTHSSFVIMAWSSDSDIASSMTVIFIPVSYTHLTLPTIYSV